MKNQSADMAYDVDDDKRGGGGQMTDRKPEETDRKMIEKSAGRSSNVFKRKTFQNVEVELEERQGTQALEKDSARGSFVNEVPQDALDDNHFEKQMCFGRMCTLMRNIILHLSAFLTFLIFNIDILYALRAPFKENYLKYTVAFLIIRYAAVFLVWLWWMYRNKSVASSNVYENEQQQNQNVLNVVFKLFRNLRGMPLFIALGFYKLLPNKDFRCEIIIGYVVEVFTSLLPMMSVQVMNNSAMEGSLTWLQATSLTLRIISLLLFGIEILIFLWESFTNFKNRDSHLRQYKRLSDQQRVQAYGPRHSKIATVGLISSLVIIFLGSMFISRRNCLPTKPGEQEKILNWGVCTECPANCVSCDQIDSCKKCSSGYYLLLDSSQCLDCDSDSYSTLCKECEAPAAFSGLMPRCLSCADGLHIDPDNGVCRTCEQITMVPNCVECDAGNRQCTKCGTGFYLPEDPFGVKGRECLRCHDQFEFCGECIQGRCWKCMDRVAKFDSKDRCTVCQDPWVQMKGEWGDCYCPSIAVLGPTFQCLECHELMAGCRKCEYTRQRQPWELSKWVGWDSKISAHGVQYVETNRYDEPEYVKCVEGDGMSAVNIIVNQTTEAVVECNHLIDGCFQCSSSRDRMSVSCESCNYGFHLKKSIQPFQSKAFGIYLQDTCSPCQKSFGEQCIDCDQQKCTLCAPTYELDQWNGQCIKCQYEWMCQNQQS